MGLVRMLGYGVLLLVPVTFLALAAALVCAMMSIRVPIWAPPLAVFACFLLARFERGAGLASPAAIACIPAGLALVAWLGAFGPRLRVTFDLRIPPPLPPATSAPPVDPTSPPRQTGRTHSER